MDARPQIGQLVKVLRGKDEDSYAIIIAIVDERFVLIADGNKRRFDQPKKKNVLHLELLPAISPEARDSLQETGRVTNAKLRYAIQKFAYAKGE
ncbi:KOW domain-containing RNA-binding protein [Paenibacillus sp. J5C_2022]|uniref:KOW domain-containing RNA-binding protein n=1 Tax=Paenibacillus sp. J5C2022 TaxID=2977129 RepID=UPI0021D02604|nr:KOW domain-containing RNA-binding protein [Paenibacillus sp. J5C2022]MCU6711692.1 KOW domain-containing RNA-binding protein [Paenibacillus sp. J5C2022]